MFSLSNHKKGQLIFVLFIVLSITFSLSNSLFAQTVNPIITVVPPYSNKLSDYTSQPNKISIILSLSMRDITSQSLYLEGSITSLNGDIQIYTHPGHKPIHPVIVTPKVMPTGGGVFLPYQLTYPEVRDIFDENWLVFKGITKQQVLKDGLPEGAYRICVKVFKYTTNELLSNNDVCSNMFNVSSVDAPSIIQPPNNSEITAASPQMVTFSWAISPGSPINTKYNLKILQLDNPAMNPQDAFNSTGYPVFFQTEVLTPMYIYTAVNPQLIVGKKYAFLIRAFDPAGNTNFKNKGQSEVYSFTYGSAQNATLPEGESQIYIINPQYNHPDSALYAGENTNLFLRWTLNDPSIYNDPYKSKQKKGPNKDTLVVKSAKYRVDFFNATGSTTNPIRTAYCGAWSPFYQISEAEADKFMVKNQSYRFKVTLLDTTSHATLGESVVWSFKYKKAPVPPYQKSVVKGRLRYHFQGETETYPVQATIKLQAGYFLKTGDGKEMEVTPGNNAIPSYQGNSVETDAQGNFMISYNKSTQAVFGVVDSTYSYTSGGKSFSGMLSYSLRIQIENPYYYQSEQNIVLSKADTVNVGDIVTYVRGYTLKSFVTRGYTSTSQVSQQLTGKIIYLFRKNNPQGTPPNEGTQGMAHFDAGEQFGYYLLIGKEVASQDVDKNGKQTASVTFQRLIANLVPGDEYYMLVEGSNMNTAQKVSFTETGENHESGNSIGIFEHIPGFSIQQLGKQYETYQSIETFPTGPDYNPVINPEKEKQKIISPEAGAEYHINTNVAAGQQKVMSLNVEKKGYNSNMSGGQKMTVMSLQTGNKGYTYADQKYYGMAGTDFMVQSLNGQSYQNGQNQINTSGQLKKIDANTSAIGQALESLEDYPIINKDGQYSFKVKTAYRIVTDAYPTSIIKGKLVYTWPNKPGFTKPLANTNITLIQCSVADVGGKSKMINADLQSTELKTVKTDGQGNFSIEFNNVNVGIGQSSSGFSGKVCSGITENSSKYQFQYNTIFAATVKSVFRIIVPNNTIYTSPDNNIVVKPLETIDVGTITSNVLSRKMKGQVVALYNSGEVCSDQAKEQCGTFDTEVDASNIECYLIKPTIQIESNINPEGEGTSSATGTLDEMPGYEIVDKGITDGNGNYVFENILFKAMAPQVSFNPLVYFRSSGMQQGINPSFSSTLVTSYPSMLDYTPKYLFNSDYNYIETDNEQTTLHMNAPILKGQVVSDMNVMQGISGAECKLRVYKTPSDQANGYGTDITAHTDANGYFVISLDQFQQESHSWVKSLDQWRGLSADFTIKKDGFGYKDSNGNWTAVWSNPFPNQTFIPGKQIVLNNIVMVSRGDINGKIFCKTATAPVPAFLQFVEVKPGGIEGAKGKIELFDNGTFQHLKVLPGNHKIIVIPQDPAYFADTIPLHVNDGTATNVNLEVFERLHRVRFYVKTKVGSNALSGATVVLCDGQGTFLADGNGKVEMSFKNISVDNLTLKVTGPSGSNYIPKYITFHNEESETITILPNVTLEMGIGLTGKVMLNGQPTHDARVYADVKNVYGMDFSTGSEYSYASKSIFEAQVNNDGTFVFNALPPEISGKDVPIYAVYSSMQSTATNQTMVGDSKVVHIPVQQPLVLNLTSFQNMKVDNIWGFPLQLTKLEKLQNNHLKVSGLVKLKNYSPGFDILNEENVQFLLYDIEMQKSATENGVDIYEPASTFVTFNALRKLKLKYAKSYNTELTYDGDGNQLLRISKSGTGIVKGYVRIIDNSFKYPSSYLTFDPTQFYFYLHKEQNNNSDYPVYDPVESTINAFNSATTGNGDQIVKYYLKQRDKLDLDFKFIGFNTTAKSYSSYIEGTAITLDATLTAPIKNAGTSQIHLPKLVLRDNKIDPSSSSTPIMLTLNDGSSVNTNNQWKFEARNWSIDPSEGGLFSQDCMLHTGKIDIPFGLFNLRSDFAYFDQPNANGINLGGIALQFQGSDAAFDFNPHSGSDKKGHWELILFPQSIGTPVAKIAGTNLSPNLQGNLELETVSLLSNGEDVFTISPNAGNMNLYKLASFKPMIVTTRPDGFQLFGSTSLKIPRLPDALGAYLDFSNTKPMVIEPLYIPFTGKGNIKFDPDMDKANDPNNGTHQLWSTGQFIAYGGISEPGKLETVHVKLTHKGPTNPVTDVVESEKEPAQKIKIGKQTTYLENISCKMHADANDWDNFTYEGDMAGFSGMEGKNHTKFTVFGEIKATGSDLKATGLVDNNSSAFSGLELTYDNGRIIGSINLPETQLGSFKAAASMNILLDKDGWMFYGNGTASNVPMPDPCQANIGFLIGYYNSDISADVENITLKYAVRKVFPENFKSGKLHGFFVLAGRDLPIKGLDVGFDVVVASAYLEVPVAGIDVYVYMNNNSFVGGIDAKVVVAFGLNSITCTSLYGSATACVNLYGGIINGSLNIGGCAGLSTKLGIKQEVPLVLGCGGTIFDASIGFDASFDISAHPFNVNLHLGKNTCSLCQ